MEGHSPEEIKRPFRERVNKVLPIMGLGLLGMAVPAIIEFYGRGKNSPLVIVLGLVIWTVSVLVSAYSLQCPACGKRFPFRRKFSRSCSRCDAELY